MLEMGREQPQREQTENTLSNYTYAYSARLYGVAPTARRAASRNLSRKTTVTKRRSTSLLRLGYRSPLQSASHNRSVCAYILRNIKSKASIIIISEIREVRLVCETNRIVPFSKLPGRFFSPT